MTILGMDLGGTKTAFRLVGPRGSSRETVLRWPGGDDPAADLDAIAGVLCDLRAESGSPVTAVGVSAAATVDECGQVVAWPSRPNWVGVDLRGYLASELPGAAVRIADDGDLATLAEVHDAGRADLLYVGVGTGVGGGLFLGGGLLRSPHGPVAEIGHILVAPGGPRCLCGRCGCLQAIASGPATVRRAARHDRAVTDAAGLRAALTAGARWAARTAHETAEALAAAVVTVSELVRPARVRIGGGFAFALPELVPAVDAAVRALARRGHPVPAVEPAAHGGLSSLTGAVLLAQDLVNPMTGRN